MQLDLSHLGASPKSKARRFRLPAVRLTGATPKVAMAPKAAMKAMKKRRVMKAMKASAAEKVTKPAKGKFAMKVAKGKLANGKLSKENLKKHEQAENRKLAEVEVVAEHGKTLSKSAKRDLVSTKMAQYGEQGKSVKLTPSEWKCVRARFATARKAQGGRVNGMWSDLERLPMRQGKGVKQKTMICAWMRDCEFSEEGFFADIEKIANSEAISRTSVWLSKKNHVGVWHL